MEEVSNAYNKALILPLNVVMNHVDVGERGHVLFCDSLFFFFRSIELEHNLSSENIELTLQK